MNWLAALFTVLAIVALAWAGALYAGTRMALAGLLPVAAAIGFVAGIVVRVLGWAKSPVPFRIPLTAGQHTSFPWLGRARLDNPSTAAGAAGRMALEVLLFRSLFRHVKADILPTGRLVFREGFAFPLAALVFHYSLLVIVLRHLRLVTQPVPAAIAVLCSADSFFQLGVPAIYTSDVIFIAALGYLLARRLRDASLRYLSLFADYFPVLLLLGIATSGVLMRHVVRVDVVAVKELALGLATLSAREVPASLHPLVFAHLALVCVLVASFPFTKLVHMAGIFLSPTRNLANTSRARRHVNPWSEPASAPSYREWEDEFRDKMIGAGVPLDGSADHV